MIKKSLVVFAVILMIFASLWVPAVGAYSKYTEYDNEKLIQLVDSGLLHYAPKVEETLPEEYREDILKQVSLLYPDTDINDIKIQYYGKLSNQIWGFDSFSEPQTLTVHIKWLRQKIEADPKKPKHIVTVWGVGYRYER